MRDIALTEEQITELAETKSTTDRGFRKAANALMREQSGVKLVNRAIRQVNKLERANGATGGLEYVYMVNHSIGEILRKEQW